MKEIAKHYADLYLTTQSNLAYTILHPVPLKEEPSTGKIEINVSNFEITYHTIEHKKGIFGKNI